MPTGRVKWFNNTRGFGFITSDDGGPDLFVHYTGIAGAGRGSLQVDTRVSFAVRESAKGLEAYDVFPIAAPPSPATEPERGRLRKRFTLPRAARRMTGRRSG